LSSSDLLSEDPVASTLDKVLELPASYDKDSEEDELNSSGSSSSDGDNDDDKYEGEANKDEIKAIYKD